MNYNDTITHTSTLPEFSEVSFTIRKMSRGIRSKIRLQLAPALAEIRDKTEVIGDLIEKGQFEDKSASNIPDDGGVIELVEEIPDKPAAKMPIAGAKFTREQIKLMERIGDINNEIEIITANKVDIVYLQHNFVSIEGLKIEGHKHIDYKILYEHAPETLCEEIIARIKEQAGLSAFVKQNLELPITSGAQADGLMSDTNAPIASDKATGSEGTVVSISQST